MALARCDHCGPPAGTKHRYPHAHKTLARILCAGTNCLRPAVVWLSELEQEQYVHGLREFRIIGHGVVRVE